MLPSTVHMPAGGEWLSSATYASGEFPSMGIRRSLSYDGRRSGEVIGDGFTELFGLELGTEDSVSYFWNVGCDFARPMLLIRYRSGVDTGIVIEFAGKAPRGLNLPASTTLRSSIITAITTPT